MSTISIAEIINKTAEMSSKKDKVEFLQKNDSNELRLVLALTYDKVTYQLHFPESVPPYTPSQFPDSHGLLYREARKLKYFVQGFAGDKMHPVKRESLFIQMLETVDKEDSIVLCHLVQRKPFTGLTVATLNAAFGEDFIKTKKGTKGSK